jgi:hypothetical protein
VSLAPFDIDRNILLTAVSAAAVASAAVGNQHFRQAVVFVPHADLPRWECKHRDWDITVRESPQDKPGASEDLRYRFRLVLQHREQPWRATSTEQRLGGKENLFLTSNGPSLFSPADAACLFCKISSYYAFQPEYSLRPANDK